MNDYIFTFGQGQVLAGFCQPIVADNFNEAERIMQEHYGKKYCMGYTPEQWNDMKDDPNRYWPLEVELPAIFQEEE